MIGRVTSRVDRYLAHLSGLTGGAEPTYHMVPSTKDGLPGVTAIVYRDLPEPGHLTAFTYGLSLARHPSWRVSRPELCITVRSDDLAWAVTAAYLAEGMRGSCPFAYGDLIEFGHGATPGSGLTSYLVYWSIVEDEEGRTGIEVGDDDVISIVGLYPIHEVERRWIAEHGATPFWLGDWDPSDVERPPSVG
jgi:hypothetical protein